MSEPQDPAWQNPADATSAGPGSADQSGWGSIQGPSGYQQAPPPPGQYGQPQYPPPPGQYGQPQYPPPTGQYGQPQYGAAPAGYAQTSLQPGVVPLRPLGLGEIYDGAFRSIRHNPRVMFGLPALVVAVGSVLGFALAYFLTPYVSQFLIDFLGITDFSASEGDDLANMYATTIALTPSTMLVQFISTTLLTGLLTASVSRSVIGQRITAAAVWSGYGRRALLLIPYSIVLGLVEAVAVFLLLAPGLFVSGSATALGISLLGIGSIAATVLLFWLTIRTLLVPPALVLEGQGLWATVVRAWKLTRGSFWRLTGIYVLAAVIVGIVNQVITTPISIIGSLFLMDGAGLGYVLTLTLAAGLGLIISLAFLAPVVALQYIDLRIRREGLDIELARAAGA